MRFGQTMNPPFRSPPVVRFGSTTTGQRGRSAGWRLGSGGVSRPDRLL